MLVVIGLIEPESLTETVFEAPRRKVRATDIGNHSDDTTHLLTDTDSNTDSMATGQDNMAATAADGYVNVNLDEDRDSEFELVQ